MQNSILAVLVIWVFLLTDDIWHWSPGPVWTAVLGGLTAYGLQKFQSMRNSILAVLVMWVFLLTDHIRPWSPGLVWTAVLGGLTAYGLQKLE